MNTFLEIPTDLKWKMTKVKLLVWATLFLFTGTLEACRVERLVAGKDGLVRGAVVESATRRGDRQCWDVHCNSYIYWNLRPICKRIQRQTTQICLPGQWMPKGGLDGRQHTEQTERRERWSKISHFNNTEHQLPFKVLKAGVNMNLSEILRGLKKG